MKGFSWSKSNPRIAFVVAVDRSVNQFEGQIAFLAANGFHVDAICSPGTHLEALRLKELHPGPYPLSVRSLLRATCFRFGVCGGCSVVFGPILL